jgi:hypothetical protein
MQRFLDIYVLISEHIRSEAAVEPLEDGRTRQRVVPILILAPVWVVAHRWRCEFAEG